MQQLYIHKIYILPYGFPAGVSHYKYRIGASFTNCCGKIETDAIERADLQKNRLETSLASVKFLIHVDM
jgi:hypothetical protein